MAPVTGAVGWTHEMKERISKAMEKIKSVNHPILDGDEMKVVKLKYVELLATLEGYEKQEYDKWAENIIDETESNLNKPLLKRVEGLLYVNFDPKVVALIREMRYFEALQVNAPETAQNIYSHAEVFRKFIFSLEHISNTYNSIRTGVLDVERPLIGGKVSMIDTQVEQAMTTMSWNSEGIQEYIQEISASVGNLNSVLQVTKNNIGQIQKIMRSWYSSPLVERKDGKKLLNLEEKDSKLQSTYDMIKRDGETIHELVNQTRLSLEADEDSEKWENYRSYVDALVREGYHNAIKTSLEYLEENMNKEKAKTSELGPLLESKLELDGDMLVFTPGMDEDAEDGFKNIIETLLDDIYDISSLMPRIAPTSQESKSNSMSAISGHHTSPQNIDGEPLPGSAPSGDDIIVPSEEEREYELHQIQMENQTYRGEMRRDAKLASLRNQIMESVREIIEDCVAYRDSYDQYTYLWTENRQEYMKNFLTNGKPADEENSEPQQTDHSAQLEKFETEIRKFESIHKTVMNMEIEVLFQAWFRVDAKPLKQSLNVVVKKWSYTLTKYLSDDAVATLDELNKFVKHNKKGLQNKIEEGDYNGLVSAMGLLHAIKHRTQNIDHMFEPLRKTINLLRQFGVEMPDEIHKMLNDLPEEWSEVKKLSVSIKDHVAPLQAKEVDVLQQKCNRFEMRNHNFREEFRKKAPFKFDLGPTRAYELIDQGHLDVFAMETESSSIKTSCELFELSVPNYRQLIECRRDIVMLKSVWDVVGLVTFMFQEWKTTLWTEIDTEAMETRCRDLAKELRRMDKEIKAWDVYGGLDQMVKDMVTSLRAVGELRSNAIRERHWKQLMKTTGVTFVLTKDMKFQDLLSLQLHKYEDDVKVIVDRATKELAMEKVLNDLSKTWSVMEFTYEVHESTQIPLLRSSEELIETLEDNQVMLQNMMASKYVAHFETQITKWQNTLSTVDSVITLWMEVQQTWSHLENIFMGSEDIRAQLPEDSRRFDQIDTNYKDLMKEASKTPNCVEACTKEGLYERLEHLQGQLALCEKSLAEYLETKRLAFPRFYFVSGSDLLDILAKGNMPQAVAVHLSKLFDSISRLEFEKNGKGDFTKTAIGMYSKEDEYVAFVEPCECTGPVEVWLNRLVDMMRKTLRQLLSEAVASYEEKPREQWIFDHPAQITLAGTQIWWTTEVNVTFGRLEEGYENSMKDYYKKQVNQLTALIGLVQGDLKRGDRQMIMTVCTLDVHARDIVAKLIVEKAENAQCFSWQAQLRLRWDEDQNDCLINICDALFRYNYEYLGNTPRLVVTALTDRCYITLTQSLHLIMGGEKNEN
ncbi:hypothetical protein HK096_001712 [Nowakowskiella sp. JEL0078]|nr:hypothetical protein HK096_001712 [Nowakowskiella sp. JEL0078]